MWSAYASTCPSHQQVASASEVAFEPTSFTANATASASASSSASASAIRYCTIALIDLISLIGLI